jgi:hypothetical protein
VRLTESVRRVMLPHHLTSEAVRISEGGRLKLPVDTSAIAFLCALEPQPVLDFETRRPRADENGEPLYVIQLIALAEGAAEILAVKVPGMPSQAIRQGHPVKVHGLVAQPWTMNDRSGVAFRAARVEPAVPAAKAS